MKKLSKTAKVLNLLFVLIVIYILFDVSYFIKSQLYFDGLLRTADPPFIIYAFRWFCASLILTGISSLKNKPQRAYLLINSASLSIIWWKILQLQYFFFYPGFIYLYFFLELISIGLIVTTNLGVFIKYYNIHRKLSDIFFIIIIPIVVTFLFCYLLLFHFV